VLNLGNTGGTTEHDFADGACSTGFIVSLKRPMVSSSNLAWVRDFKKPVPSSKLDLEASTLLAGKGLLRFVDLTLNLTLEFTEDSLGVRSQSPNVDMNQSAAWIRKSGNVWHVYRGKGHSWRV
jgi:hypothetical protein